MDRYLFSRTDWYDPGTQSAVALSTQVFFQMWRTRMDPYLRFREDDLVYIGDTRTRRLYWEVRPANLLKDFHYTSTRHALAALRVCYGLRAGDLNNYHQTRAGSGWLMAWSPVVLRRLDRAMPAGMRFGQNGYRRLTDAEVDTLNLRTRVARKPMASPPPWYDASAAKTGVVRKVPRYIPEHVRRAVVERDGNRCVGCGATSNLHLDHILPWSQGGPSSVANLRLLCASSNLARGVGRFDDVLRCAQAA